MPCEDLPLQATLHFTPCAVPLAVTYLQAVCLAQGFAVPRDMLTKFYHDETDEDEEDDTKPHLDLRHALMQLQYFLASGCAKDGGSALPPGPSTDLVHTAGSHSFSSPISSIPDDDAPSPIAADQPREKHEATLLVLMSKAWDAASYIDSHLSRETHAHVRVRENAFFPSCGGERVGG